MKPRGPKVLLLDIETSPILAHVWGLWENNVALNQIEKDWHILSWAAKWLGAPAKSVMYEDQRHAKDIGDERSILIGIHKLLDEADIVVTQNGKKFDIKKLNARFIIHGMQPPSSFRQIDTLELAKKHFGFTSNKLEYMSEKLCKKYKKLKHKKFPGFELWTECLKGNIAAWKEMELYNKHDVLSLEELYTKMAPWDTAINFNTYTDGLLNNICRCGSKAYKKKGYSYTNAGKFQRYICLACGQNSSDKVNLLSKEKRRSLRRAG